MMEYWRRKLPDYETTVVLMAIISIGAGRIADAPVADALKDLNNKLPTDQLAKCNFSSVAAATNLDRQTVKRKVDRLVELGLVERVDRDNVRVEPSVGQRPFVGELATAHANAICSTTNTLIRDGILRLTTQQFRASAA
ncbi:MarR family transcriptional regulator [Sphingomonas xanthus]|nr:MarR family transcriptional regulator [Sphingomonas xanthus]